MNSGVNTSTTTLAIDAPDFVVTNAGAVLGSLTVGTSKTTTAKKLTDASLGAAIDVTNTASGVSFSDIAPAAVAPLVVSLTATSGDLTVGKVTSDGGKITLAAPAGKLATTGLLDATKPGADGDISLTTGGSNLLTLGANLTGGKVTLTSGGAIDATGFTAAASNSLTATAVGGIALACRPRLG